MWLSRGLLKKHPLYQELLHKRADWKASKIHIVTIDELVWEEYFSAKTGSNAGTLFWPGRDKASLKQKLGIPTLIQ